MSDSDSEPGSSLAKFGLREAESVGYPAERPLHDYFSNYVGLGAAKSTICTLQGHEKTTSGVELLLEVR